MGAAASAAAAGGQGPVPPPVPVPIPRDPLGPFPQPVDYPSVLPFAPPTERDLYFYRGQFCGLRVKGAPAVPGSNADNPECVMAALLDNYPQWVQEEFLRLYVGYGYTHLQRSAGHALGYGHSVDDFIALSQKAQRVGLFSDVWFIANEIPGFQWNQDWGYWGPLLNPLIDRLLGAGVIDLACPSWQMDQVMGGAPGNATISIIAGVADRLPRATPVYTHWMNGAMAWWKTGGEQWSDKYQSLWIANRFDWWRAMAPYLTGGHHQGSTTMAIKEYQDRICDTLDYFGGRTDKGSMGQSWRTGAYENYRMTVYECSAQDQFNGDSSEADGDLRSYLLLCTTTPWAHLSGYGNGCRMPSGAQV